MMKIAILGAGPAGLSLAYHLNDSNVSVDVYDQHDKPGGLATSIELWDNKVELGPHFLRKGGSPELDSLIKSVMDPKDYAVINRNTKILFDNKKFNYPPNPIDILRQLKFGQLFAALVGMLLAQLRPHRSPTNAQDYLKSKLGNTFYTLFIKTYSEKLWGKSPAELHPSYAENLLPFSGPNAIFKKIINAVLYRKPTDTLWDFPNGFDVLWHSTYQQVSNKHTFYLGTKIHRINHHDGRVESISSELGTKYYDVIISTIPAFTLFSLLNQPVPANPPSFRHALLVYFLVSGDIRHQEHCLYLYSPEYKAIRLTHFGTLSSSDDKNILMLEYWLSDEELLKKAFFLQLASVELEAINGTVLQIEQQHHIVLQKAYRTPNHELYKQHSVQQDLLSNYHNLLPLGRNNNMNFNYGMEQAVSEGAQMARKLIRQSQEVKQALVPAGADA